MGLQMISKLWSSLSLSLRYCSMCQTLTVTLKKASFIQLQWPKEWGYMPLKLDTNRFYHTSTIWAMLLLNKCWEMSQLPMAWLPLISIIRNLTIIFSLEAILISISTLKYFLILSAKHKPLPIEIYWPL